MRLLFVVYKKILIPEMFLKFIIMIHGMGIEIRLVPVGKIFLV